MNARILLPALLALVAATACNGHGGDNDQAHDSGHGAVIKVKGITLDNGNLQLHTEQGDHTASLSPQGDLSIDGQKLQLSDAQRQRVLDYRKRISDIADQGIEVGKQGAALGVQAAGDALKGVFNGNTEDIGKKVEAQAEQIKQQALKICDSVENLRSAQDALVAAVPQFAPYAELDASSAADCRKDSQS